LTENRGIAAPFAIAVKKIVFWAAWALQNASLRCAQLVTCQIDPAAPEAAADPPAKGAWNIHGI
jgi:hypothetical protein